MRVMVVGGTGTIGRALVGALERGGHRTVVASRSSPTSVDLGDPAGVTAAIEGAGPLDAVVVCAAHGPLMAVSEVTAEAYQRVIRAKLVGQIHVLTIAARQIAPGGHVLLTTGRFDHRVAGAATGASINAALEAYVRTAAHELAHIHVNAVSIGWVRETLETLGLDPEDGVPAAEVADLYLDTLASQRSGEVVTLPTT